METPSLNTLVALRYDQSKLSSSLKLPKEIFLVGRGRNEDRFMDITCIIQPFKRTPNSRSNYLQQRLEKERKRKDFPQFYYHINPKRPNKSLKLSDLSIIYSYILIKIRICISMHFHYDIYSIYTESPLSTQYIFDLRNMFVLSMAYEISHMCYLKHISF